MVDYQALWGHLRGDLSPYYTSEVCYTSDMSLKTVYAKGLADSFYKKLCPTTSSESADAAALEKFKAVNARIPDGKFDFSADDEADASFYSYFKSNLNRCVGFDIGDRNYDLDFIRSHMDVGPGAAQKADASHIVSKLFEGEMSYNGPEFLIALYRAAIVDTGSWADAEMHRFTRFGFTKVDGTKIFFAKKNAEISRTCGTESNLGMLFQKSLGAYFEYRLFKHFGINLSVQADFNKSLARIGSIDGSFGTIDLVSASDSVNTQLVLDSFDDGFHKSIMMMCRSELAILPNSEKLVLKMISTMGNGFTFPLQTIIFASAVKSVYQLMGYPCADPSSQFGVFGDDIIVRREAYVYLARMLAKLGFEVNEAKSFNNGPFRESCGGDFYNGHNVRGIYISSLETPQLVCSAINRLLRWSARSGIKLHKTIEWLLQLVPKAPYVPPSESDEAGLHVPFRSTIPVVTDAYWYRYRYYKRRLRKIVVAEPDCCPNPHGMAVGFLSGHIRRPDVSIRDLVRSRHEGPHHEVPWCYQDIHYTPRSTDDVERYKIARDRKSVV